MSWEVAAQSEARLRFRWVESGLSLAEGEPRRRGFGTELLERTLAYELGATASARFEPGGISWTIEVPLGERVSAPGAH